MTKLPPENGREKLFMITSNSAAYFRALSVFGCCAVIEIHLL